MNKFYIACRVAREDEERGAVYSTQIVEATENTFVYAGNGGRLVSCRICKDLDEADGNVDMNARYDMADDVYDSDPIPLHVERGELIYAGGAALLKGD